MREEMLEWCLHLQCPRLDTGDASEFSLCIPGDFLGVYRTYLPSVSRSFSLEKRSKSMETHPGFWRHFAIEKTGLSSGEKPLVKPGNPLGFLMGYPEDFRGFLPSRENLCPRSS
jgi:hypothetical protein